MIPSGSSVRVQVVQVSFAVLGFYLFVVDFSVRRACSGFGLARRPPLRLSTGSPGCSWERRCVGAGGWGAKEEVGCRLGHRRGPGRDSAGAITPSLGSGGGRGAGGASAADASPAQTRAQSNSTSSRQSLCNSTASLRATATRARFAPFFSCKAKPQVLSAQGRFSRPSTTLAAS